MAMASSLWRWLSVPCLVSSSVAVLNNLQWPINFNRHLSARGPLRHKEEADPSAKPSGLGQKRQMLKSVKSCWLVNNDGLHTTSPRHQVLNELPLRHDGGVGKVTTLGLEVRKRDIVIQRYSLFCWFFQNGCWTVSLQHCPRQLILWLCPVSNSKMLMKCSKVDNQCLCRHIVSQYLFALHPDCSLETTFRQPVVGFCQYSLGSLSYWGSCLSDSSHSAITDT